MDDQARDVLRARSYRGLVLIGNRQIGSDLDYRGEILFVVVFSHFMFQLISLPVLAQLAYGGELPYTAVFVPGEANRTCYRIPGLIEVPAEAAGLPAEIFGFAESRVSAAPPPSPFPLNPINTCFSRT